MKYIFLMVFCFVVSCSSLEESKQAHDTKKEVAKANTTSDMGGGSMEAKVDSAPTPSPTVKSGAVEFAEMARESSVAAPEQGKYSENLAELDEGGGDEIFGAAEGENAPNDKQEKAEEKAEEKKEEAEEEAEEKDLPSSPKEEKTTTLYLSADDSNSQASPVIVNKRIYQGRYVEPNVIRTYEFLNYYSFDYPPAKKNTVAIYPEMQKTETEGQYTLQVAVRSENRSRADVLPLNFTFLVDVSGSMAGKSMKLAKSFIKKFVTKMKKGDRFSLVVCNRHATTVIDSFRHSYGNIEDVYSKIEQALKPDDVTDLHRGIVEAYRVAQKNYIDEFLNRVVLLSDGATNAGKLAVDTISKHSEDSEKQSIYLVGVGFGEGFNDSLMNAFTDAGKGAYFFIDSTSDIDKALGENFISNFDLAIKDVRLKMVMPGSWSMIKFHGEQVSTIASEVIPQHLSPNDQMIYHQILGTTRNVDSIKEQEFVFEAEFRDAVSNQVKKVTRTISVQEMLKASLGQIAKGNAIVAFAEMFKECQRPLLQSRSENLKIFDAAFAKVRKAEQDTELKQVVATMQSYRKILEQGEILPRALDKESFALGDSLGLTRTSLQETKTRGSNTRAAIKSIEKLGKSMQLVPREGYRFLAISTGPVGNMSTKGHGELRNVVFSDPTPQYMGSSRNASSHNPRVYDLHQVTLTLKAPMYAKSFSFDFNYFSAEYPEYVKQNYNDTFYAIIEASSTNNGATTNIAFDANRSSIEVDNNYFQNPFHPISNRGTGFGKGGSTSWLRTSWPIRGGETFKLTFSVHDEGDAIYDSLVIIDNFKWHKHPCVGNTDPLN